MSSNLFSLIKSRVSILDVINTYITLKKAGHYWKAPCPFHSEKTGSFTVSPHKEIFYCFGCHATGDAISFIAKIENCSALEAAKLLADRYKIEVPEFMAHNEPTQSEKKIHHATCEAVAQWCHAQLKTSRAASAYLESRKISKQTIDQFNIGYFPGGLNATRALLDTLKKAHIMAEDLIEAGILIPGKQVFYSPFEERIIFPIKDHLGNAVGFGGRIFKEHDTRPKYYNSKENKYFSKGELIFGLDVAKKDIQKQESAFLVEGYTDCIAMAQHGYPNSVATLGTACTLEHLKILARYTPKIYVLYDGDNAGQQAMLRLAQLCWQATLDLHVIILPAQEDPASFLTKHKSLEGLIEKAQEIFDYFITTLGKDYAKKSLSEKLAIAKKIVETIQTIDDRLKQDILFEKASGVLSIPFESLKGYQTNKPTRSTPDLPQGEPSAPQAPAHNTELIPKLEKRIFFAIMSNIHLLTSENAWYLLHFLPSPLRDILDQLYEEKEANKGISFDQFFAQLSPAEQQYTNKILLEEGVTADEGNFETLLSQLQKNHWKVIVNDIKKKIDQAKKNGQEEKVKELVTEFINLRHKLISKELI